MKPTGELDMDDYDRELLEEALGFVLMTAGLAAQESDEQAWDVGEG